MTTTDTPEKDPIQDLMEKKQAKIEDVEDKGKEKETGKQVEETKEDLKKEKETTQTQQEIKEELSVFSLITRTEVLIEKYKDFKKHAKKYSRNKEDKGYEEAFKGQAENRLRRLENIKRFLNKFEKKTGDLDGASLNRYNREINSINDEVALFEQGRDEIVMEKTGLETPYTIDIHTFKDTKEIIKANDDVNRMLKKLDLLELDAALKTELKEELESLQRYLEASISGKINAGTQPFQFKHYEDFVQLRIIDPKVYPIFDNQKNNKNDNKSTNYNQPNYVLDANGNVCPRTVVNYNNLNEAWKKGGVMGAIDYGFQKTNMTPQQRQFRHGAGNLALIGGGIFLGRKALKSVFGIFSKDKEKRNAGRGRLAGIAGGTILLQGATGKNPIQAIKELFNGGGDIQQRISSLFGGGKNGVKTGAEVGLDTKPEQIAYVHGFAGLPAIFGGMTIADMKGLLVQEGGRTKIKDYKTLAEFLRAQKNENGAKMVENLAQNSDNYNIVDITLSAMGLDRDKIEKGGTEKFDKYTLNATKNLIALDTYMIDKGYNGIKMEQENFRNSIKNFIATGSPALETIDKKGAFIKGDNTKEKQEEIEDKDWRIKQFDIAKDDKLNLKTSIDTFTSLTPQEKNNLIAAGNILAKDTGNAIIEFKEIGSIIYLKTHKEWTAIDVTNKMMKGFNDKTNTIYFEGLVELVSTANLTNYIKHLFRGKHTGNVPANGEYFARSTLWYNIKTFTPLNGLGDLVYAMKQGDNGKNRRDPRSYGRTMDTEVIDSGWFSDLKKTSPTLNTYIGEYADYLNKLDIRHTGTKNDKLPT